MTDHVGIFVDVVELTLIEPHLLRRTEPCARRGPKQWKCIHLIHDHPVNRVIFLTAFKKNKTDWGNIG